MVPLDTSPLTVFFMLFGLGYLVALVYTVVFDRRRTSEEGTATAHRFSLIVPLDVDDPRIVSRRLRYNNP